ncbi:rRNA methyltransferase 2, mitochondrial [Cichlidogyrus casuarinus]|uniref:rRNA methyltransferase 2, mitochondrial n=1 Tax=Cichlidogyrus casuarinus TaxID=1844966 RepID=A0ABD2QHK3_9PLAT
MADIIQLRDANVLQLYTPRPWSKEVRSCAQSARSHTLNCSLASNGIERVQQQRSVVWLQHYAAAVHTRGQKLRTLHCNRLGTVVSLDLQNFQQVSPAAIALCGTDLNETDKCRELILEALERKFSHVAMPCRSGENVPLADVILSDIAPNASGQKSIDIPAMMKLCNAVLRVGVRLINITNSTYKLAACLSKPGATLVVKQWESSETQNFMKQCELFYKGSSSNRQKERAVKIMKPDASRENSAEVYVVARGFEPLSRDV